MKIYFYVLMGCVFLSRAQLPTINVPCANTPTIDGTVMAGEWDAADTLRIGIGQNKTVKVYAMCDRNNLFFLFSGNLESQVRFPEVMIDGDNSKSATWQSNDWWFHVSATDCENQGAYGIYNSCQLVQAGWTANNNITQGQPLTEQVEIAIPYAKLNFTVGATNTLGICFDVTNTFNATNVWPANASVNAPSTWGNALLSICEPTSIREEESAFLVKIFPNPGNGKLIIDWRNAAQQMDGIMLRDITGKVVYFGQHAQVDEVHLDLAIDAGIYFVSLLQGDKVITTKKLFIH